MKKLTKEMLKREWTQNTISYSYPTAGSQTFIEVDIDLSNENNQTIAIIASQSKDDLEESEKDKWDDPTAFAAHIVSLHNNWLKEQGGTPDIESTAVVPYEKYQEAIESGANWYRHWHSSETKLREVKEQRDTLVHKVARDNLELATIHEGLVDLENKLETLVSSVMTVMEKRNVG
jgi:hypothetical protein